MDRSKFLKILKDKFPHLRVKLNREMGQLHAEMAVFYSFAQECLDKGDETNLLVCFELADNFYKNGDRKLKNAIDVSFVESLSFGDQKWAWKLLPQELQKLYIAFHLNPGT